MVDLGVRDAHAVEEVGLRRVAFAFLYCAVPHPTLNETGALRVAGVLDVSGLRLVLDGTSIHVGLHREFAADRVPELLGGGRHRARLDLGAHRLVAAGVPEKSVELAITQRLAAIVALPSLDDN